MNDNIQKLLEVIAAKVTELVQIETCLAQKLGETPAAAPAAQAETVAPEAPEPAQVSIPAEPAPAQVAPAPARPGQGTIGGLVWEYCDGLTQQLGRAPTKDEMLAAIKQYAPGTPVNELTAATQYSKWRVASGLPRLPRGFAAKPAVTKVADSPVLQPRAAVAPPMPAFPAQLSLPDVSLPPWLRAQG